MHQTQQQKWAQIANIIQYKYSPTRQDLNLYNCIQCWMDVLVCRDWTMLKCLRISHCYIFDAKLKKLSNLPWPNLHQLQLRENLIGPEGVKLLVSNQWPCLEELNLNQNRIGDEGLGDLVGCFGNRLRRIQLAKNGIGSQAMLHLLEMNSFSKMQVLNLQHNKIGCSGVKMLIKMDMPALRELRIGNNRIGIEGLSYLSKGKWDELAILQIGTEAAWLNENFDYFMITYCNWKKLRNFTITRNSCNNIVKLLSIVTAPIFKVTFDVGMDLRMSALNMMKKTIIK